MFQLVASSAFGLNTVYCPLKWRNESWITLDIMASLMEINVGRSCNESSEDFAFVNLVPLYVLRHNAVRVSD